MSRTRVQIKSNGIRQVLSFHPQDTGGLISLLKERFLADDEIIEHVVVSLGQQSRVLAFHAYHTGNLGQCNINNPMDDPSTKTGLVHPTASSFIPSRGFHSPRRRPSIISISYRGRTDICLSHWCSEKATSRRRESLCVEFETVSGL